LRNTALKYNLIFIEYSDDPYYCGLRARIPNFAKTKAQKDKEAMRLAASQELPMPNNGAGALGLPHPDVWHKPQRGYHETGMIPGWICQISNIVLPQ
jgi:hypothetical protein